MDYLHCYGIVLIADIVFIARPPVVLFLCLIGISGMDLKKKETEVSF